MKRYKPSDIEPKWQKSWEDQKIHEASEDPKNPKKYILEFFPYPSGAAMHVGHVRNYTIGDALSRFYRMQGFNVLHPMGWDAFGLPAENYAIKTGISPQQAVAENVKTFKQQLMQMGFGYDWSREINSTDPDYYKWTQWFFKLLLEQGLAYQKESLQWWCETDKTVLANEQVEAGKCWRCGNLVVKKSLKQWFFKITDYADRLVEDLEDLDWSEAIKSMQRNWVGRSIGAEVDFQVDGSKEVIKIFTTRPDTLFGATFMVVAPEHPILNMLSIDKKPQVKAYVDKALQKTEVDRMETDREKTGVFTGVFANNPVNNEKVPIWVADYVLMGYGTGAIMAVPAHDERDNAFAKKYGLPIVEVVAPDFGEPLVDAVDVTGPVIVGYDPKIKKYMSLVNTKNNMLWFAAGGLEDGEDYKVAAVRELAEEAGFRKVEKMIQLGGPNYSYFYNPNKDSNRRSFSYMFLAIIDKNDQGEQELEAHEKYRTEWSDFGHIMRELEATPEGRGHWIDGMQRAKDAVVAYERGAEYECQLFTGEGVLFNSGVYSGLSTSEAREKIVADLAKKKLGAEKVNYKIRDWLISRQRYWGAPIPIIHCPKDGAVPVPDNQLPVELPPLKSYEPTGEGTSVLASAETWVNTTCPKCGGPAKRETDTMDGFACSSWYFLRFADPHNDKAAFDKEKAKFWLPVDTYIGGAEHAVMHLLYARMWTKVMFDAGLIEFEEPFTSLRNHGMISAPDGRKMSKSYGNVIAPGELIDDGYGADSIRVMELFIGPWNQQVAWSVEGMGGCYRFLQRVWTLTQEFLEAKSEKDSKTENVEILRATHQVIKKVTEDLRDLSFNTSVAALMELTNLLYKQKAEHGFDDRDAWKFAIENLVGLLAPFAPHVSEELWQDLGHKESVHVSQWPVWDDKYLVNEKMTLAVQVNGKVRAEIEVESGASEDDIKKMAEENEKVQKFLDGKKPKKVIYVAGRLVSLVL